MRPLAVTTWVLLCAPLLLSAGQRITAEAGQDSVTLPCGARKGKEITAVEWSRPDLSPKDGVLVFRGDRFESEGQHPSFMNRVDLQDRQMKDGNASLILKNVKIDDTGTYLCNVLQRGGGQKKTFIHLDVVSEHRITAEAGQDSVTLPCGAGKETQIEAVEWSRADLSPGVVLLYRDGRVESDRQHPSFRNRVDLQDRQMKDGDASLILKDVTINDAGTYECTVIQGGGNRRKRAAKEISTIHLVVSPPGTQEGGDKEARGGEEGGPAGRGHLGLGLVASVLGIVAAVLIRKRKKTPPPPPEGAPVQPLV